MSAERIRDELTKLLLARRPHDPVRGIELMVDTGVADVVLPEVPRLRLETDEHMRHKDVYQHSLTVLEQSAELEERYGLQPDLVVRLAALLHDIGKPKTRSLLPDGRVAFHHHEAVGAAMARSRLKALRFPSAVVADVTTLIALHLRFHGYGAGRVDGLRGPPLRARRRAAADPAARAHPGRLHHPEQGQGRPPGPGPGRPGGAHRDAQRAGGAREDPARPGR